MVSFERECQFGRSCRNRSAGSWCAISNRLAGLLRPGKVPHRNPDGRMLVGSLGCIVQNHRQTHARFRKCGLRGFGGVALIKLADGEMLLEHSPSPVTFFVAAFL